MMKRKEFASSSSLIFRREAKNNNKKKKKKKKKKKTTVTYPGSITIPHLISHGCFNPFMPSGLSYFKSMDRLISYIRGAWFVLLSCFVEIFKLNEV